MANNINTQSTALAKSQEKRFIKSLARIDITLFIVAAIISLDTIATIANWWLTIFILGSICSPYLLNTNLNAYGRDWFSVRRRGRPLSMG